MSNTIQNISCPNCSHQFDVEDVLAGQVEKRLKEQFDQERNALKKNFDQQQSALLKEQEAFEEKKKNENKIFKERLASALSTRQKELRSAVEEEYALKLKAQQDELEAKRKKLIELQEKEIEIERLKAKMTEQEKDIELKYEKQMRQKIADKEAAMLKRITEQQALIQQAKDKELEMRLLEKDKKLEDQKKLIDEMKRKSEQGSMQLQGEVQELAIEEILKSNFPFDNISEVAKGIRGADSIQEVINDQQQPCGTIIYESKRTKSFGGEWVAKLKEDQRQAGADIAILVTDVFPKGMTQFGEHQGIYICKFGEMLSLVHVLRRFLLQRKTLLSVQENKGGKMEMLYDYLTGTEFKNRITSIAETFQIMKNDLDKEKRAIMSAWKRREKQIEIMTDNTLSLHASVKAIGGKAIENIDFFELPEGD